MDFITVSNSALWIIVILQSIVIYALTRQVGVLFERVAPAGALAINQTIEVGAVAPNLALQSLASTLVDVGGKSKNNKSQLLFFVSPDCPVCKTLLPALKSAAKAEQSWIDLILASDGKQQDHAGFVKQYELSEYPYIVSELLGKSYGVAKLPYGVVIDEMGKIASMGIINSREHLDSLFEAKERNVASIQAYMQKDQHNEEKFVEVK
ncbi:redoxin domain-containing protein [Paraglaciecola arctica]|uniref:Methylamine utilization protein mauD n=1 Tax=Paraglaciecola arctica BSs20135 TaxID=493475 RepID=K6YPZ3_9ALTE|nr:redoxin domain-containing protein [Paraglaciecola arctica]GAC18713.1 methylamine utilization protein mauD [Paraglaciecola arctica BSs20135]